MREPKARIPRKGRWHLGKEGRSPRFGKEILLLLVILFATGVWRVVIHESHKKTPSSILTSEWQRYSPGQSQLSLLLPGEPQSELPEIPESTLTTIKQSTRYKYTLKAFDVAVSHVLYTAGASTDIRRAAEGTASALGQSPGVTEYQDNVLAITRSGRPGLLITGTFKRDGERMKMEAVLLGEGSNLWQVVVTHPARDRNSDIASQRVLGSIEIDFKRVGSLTSALTNSLLSAEFREQLCPNL